MRGKRDEDATREFHAAIPILLAAAHESADDDSATLVAAHSERLRNIVESYIALLERDRSATENRPPSKALPWRMRSAVIRCSRH